MKQLQIRRAQVSHFLRMISGRDYYHMPQGIGRYFTPWALEGYFNDMTGKVHWQGTTDAAGIPMIQMNNGHPIYFPITAFQKALGHFDLQLERREERHTRAFLLIADWAVATQDQQGGWDCWSHMHHPVVSNYSAMAQGEALSLLSRAYHVTGEQKYLNALEMACQLMQRPVDKGGVCRIENHEAIFLEETPLPQKTVVLNGWIYALFGVHDYLVLRDDAEVRSFFHNTLRTLIETLPLYDSGYWSRYDLRGNLASPFYHAVHLAQLHALDMIADARQFHDTRQQWAAYSASPTQRTRAFLVKLWQRLLHPPQDILTG